MTYPHPDNAYEKYIAENRAGRIWPWLMNSDTTLDYGCGEGLPFLRRRAPKHITAWDIDQAAMDIAVSSGRYDDANYPAYEQFDLVLLMGVLEHVDYPLDILKEIIEEYNPGTIYITVPNGQSIHREFGTALGFIDHPYDLTDGDIEFGHKRVFTYGELFSLVNQLKTMKIFTSGSSHCKIYNSVRMQDEMTRQEWKALDVATAGVVHGTKCYAGAELFMVLTRKND